MGILIRITDNADRTNNMVKSVLLAKSDVVDLSIENLARLSGPCVYIIEKQGRALYVGMSRRGLLRVLYRNSHGRDRRHRDMARIKGDNIKVHFYTTVEMASEMELYFIRKLKPRYNTHVGD